MSEQIMQLNAVFIEANGMVEKRRKEIGGDSAFDACSQAIDEVVRSLSSAHQLKRGDVEKLYAHLNKTFLEPLANAEHKDGRTNWEEK